MPERNRKDLEEIPKDIRKKMKFILVRHMDDVLKVALIKKIKKTVPARKHIMTLFKRNKRAGAAAG